MKIRRGLAVDGNCDKQPSCDLIANDSKYAEDKSCDTFVPDFGNFPISTNFSRLLDCLSWSLLNVKFEIQHLIIYG